MKKYELMDIAKGIDDDWKSLILGKVGSSRIKVLRMSGEAYPEESHEYNEALLVLEGKMELLIKGEEVTVRSGELMVVDANVPHSVLPGSFGTLVIVDM